MAYLRKGGRGLKSRSLREEYNYYSRRARERVAYEKAFRMVAGFKTGLGLDELFTPQTYDELFKEGITRKEGNRTVRYTGEEAVRIKIRSYKERASKSKQAEQFISNYCRAMWQAGYQPEEIEEVEELLSSLSIDKLTYLIHTGLPQITFVYLDKTMSVRNTIKGMVDSINTPEATEMIRSYRRKAKLIQKNRQVELELIHGKRYM